MFVNRRMDWLVSLECVLSEDMRFLVAVDQYKESMFLQMTARRG
jgi:hypothetical protein